MAGEPLPAPFVHAELDGEPLCQTDTTSAGYRAVALEAAADPDDDQAVLTCGECLMVLAAGAKPMGGSAP